MSGRGFTGHFGLRGVPRRSVSIGNTTDLDE
jgi:hypothetical protein